MQDLFCPQNQPTCGTTARWKQSDLEQYREAVVQTYLNDFTRLASRMGIPKQRIYTHVWSESEPGDPRYTNYANAAFTLYSRPGMSFYGHAKNPLGLALWKKALAKDGYPSWGAVEYSAGTSEEGWEKGLTNTLDSETPAKVLVIYNWTQHKGTGAITAIKKTLEGKPKMPSCSLPEILPITSEGEITKTLTWTFFPKTSKEDQSSLRLFISKGLHVSQEKSEIMLQNATISAEITNVSPGVYTWYVQSIGCSGKRQRTSVPKVFVVPVETNGLTVVSGWVRTFLRMFP